MFKGERFDIWLCVMHIDTYFWQSRKHHHINKPLSPTFKYGAYTKKPCFVLAELLETAFVGK